MIEFLQALDAAGIDYVSWKNNHELPDALAGRTDLDIYIPQKFATQALQLAADSDWKQLKNPVAIYPSVIHLYKLGDELQEFHLHVYFRVVTGESWLKEFVLPFDELLLEGRRRFEDFGVWGLDDKTQAYLYTIRHLLKGASLFSRMLYRREFESYRDEWRRCELDVDELRGWGPISLDRYLDGSGLQGANFALPDLRTALGFRASMAPYLRVSRFSLMPRRIGHLVTRVTNKFVLKRKKLFPQKGLVIAISGVDGAGKSTMLREADAVFSRFLTVRRCALGRPQGPILESLRRLLRPGASRSSAHARRTGPRRPTLRAALSASVLALLRLRAARQARKNAGKGLLVLADRWPTDTPGLMDGPRFEAGAGASFLSAMLIRVEHWAYRHMPRADVCFFLECPQAVLVDRNRQRVKSDKETDDEIIDRSEKNRQFEPLARRVLHFDNNGPLAQKRLELLLSMWNQMPAA